VNFDHLAPHYDWLEAMTAGARLQRARTALFDELADRRNILSVGEGHGRFAAACAARFPGADLTCVEASGPMLARARQRAAPAARIAWHQSEFLTWRPPARKFDAIVTCFFLDCFPAGELAAVIAKLARCATDDARWLVVDFARPSRGLARLRARGVHALMYAFFRLVTRLPARRLTPPDEFLRSNGFRLAARREFEWGLVRADLWQRE
jgi:ubiquinone/menaquinone biosynthesis C-methylase UbiE